MIEDLLCKRVRKKKLRRKEDDEMIVVNNNKEEKKKVISREGDENKIKATINTGPRRFFISVQRDKTMDGHRGPRGRKNKIKSSLFAHFCLPALVHPSSSVRKKIE